MKNFVHPKANATSDLAFHMLDSADPIARATTGFAEPRENVLKIGITDGMRIADFGAGSGAYSIASARVVGPEGKVYAIDVQNDLLTRIKNMAAKEHLNNIDIVWGNIEVPHGTRIKDHSVDRVIISNVLFQTDHKNEVLKEARRVLKPTGKVAVIDWLDSFGGLGPEKKSVVGKAEALKLLDAGGFSIVSEFTAGAHHYGIVARPSTQQ